MKKGISLVLALMMVLTILISTSVVATAADITSVTFTPAEPIVFWYGYETNLSQLSESVLKNKVIPVGSVMTYHYSDGTSIDLTYNGSYFVAVGYDTVSVSIVRNYKYNWEIGTDNFIILRVGLREIKVPVTVVEHPVESIEFIPEKPIEFYENMGGTKTDTYYEYFVHDSNIIYENGNRLVVNYKDGTKSTYVYESSHRGVSLIDVHGNEITSDDLIINSNQDKTHWTIGNNNYFEIKYKGISTYVPVTILENPVESISYSVSQPIEVYENIDGMDGIIYPNYFWYSYEHTDGAILTVNYKDGSSVKYYQKDVITQDFGNVHGSRFFDEWGNMLPDYGYPTIESQRNGQEKWGIGTHYFTVSYMGATCYVPVTVVENPFSAMKVNLVDYCIYERNAEEHRPYMFSILSHGNSITFTYKTGGTVTYTYDGNKLGWFDQYGNEFKHSGIKWQQYNDNWTTGQTYPVTVSLGDISDTVYITMVSNPIVSVDVVPSKPIVVYENVDCTWDEELSYMKYSSTELLPDGTAMIFRYADGTSKTYYYDKENRWLEDVNGVIISDDYTIYDFYSEQNDAFVLGKNYMYLKFSYIPFRCAVPVELRPQHEAPPYYLSLVDGKLTCMMGDRQASRYCGLLEHNGEWYYVYYGKVDGYYRELYNYQGNFYYVKNGRVDWQYTGLVYYYGDFYYIENGVLNFNKTGLVYCWDEWYYVENGAVNLNTKTLINFYDAWYYVENGEVNFNATTLVYFYGAWYYVENGVVNFDATTLVYFYGDWYYVENGVVNFDATTLVYFYGDWYYVENGVVNFNTTTLYYFYGAWYYVENGVVNFDATTLVYFYGDWYYVENGVVNFDATTLVYFYGDWYYVENGVVNFNTTTLFYFYGDWYYVENGVVNFNATTLVYFYGAWYYVENGVVNFDATTLVYFYGDWYYVENGVVNFNATTLVYFYGAWYYVENGIVNFNTSTLVNFYGAWYCVENGVVNFDVSTLYYFYGDWYCVDNGIVNFDVTTLYLFYDEWYYVENGVVNFDTTALIEFYGDLYYVEDGVVDFSYNGNFVQDGNIYKVENGVAHLFTKEEILALYQSAAQDIAQNGSAGYNKKAWQSNVDFYFSGSGNIGAVLESLIEGFMTKEEDAETKIAEINSDDAKNRMPMSNCTVDMVESATIEAKGDNYLITIVMKEQVNPEKTDADGISVMSKDILYASDVVETVETEPVVKAIVKQVNDFTLTYKEYTIQAEMTKDGNFVSITHICDMDATVDAKLLVGTMQGEGTITFNAVYSDFQY